MGLRHVGGGDAALSDRSDKTVAVVGPAGSPEATGGPSPKDEEKGSVHLGPGVGGAVPQHQGSSGGTEGLTEGSAAASAHLLAGETAGPVRLTPKERIAYRMGVSHGLVLAANALRPGGARLASRLENLRIAIAARSIDCEPPAHWPTRGGA